MIGLFGGSFDPIHHGHLIVAQAVKEALALEAVRFVPAREQPLKRGRHGATPEQRAAMIELAIAGEPGFSVERIELERPGPSYTVETLEALRAREPTTEFVLLIGADAAAELDLWHRAAELPRLARIVVFSRGSMGEAPPHPMIWRTVTVPAVDISATAIRARIRAGKSIRWWVPDPVARHIAAERLYLGGK